MNLEVLELRGLGFRGGCPQVSQTVGFRITPEFQNAEADETHLTRKMIPLGFVPANICMHQRMYCL